MKPRLVTTIRAVEKAVDRLVNECRKDGKTYPQHPKAAAQVNRTSKWLLNAIAGLREALDAPSASADRQAS